ncbi:hypothetical protein [Paraburkholderia sp. J67]|uniref:hypothetical protein n=1 Tax=Paraburkholderia sp. J67 TaxID=2805435 RepID=UPI002ABD84CB|nr:hypothetical protein [Paraburkholderia sp. J67]
MTLNYDQKRALILASKHGIDYLDTMIHHLKAESPEAFHTERTLRKRRFHHQPATDTPHRSFVVHRHA